MTGGFARSGLWRQLLSGVLGRPLGAALLGMDALGCIESIEVASATVPVTDEITPDPATVSISERQRQLFADLHRELEPASRGCTWHLPAPERAEKSRSDSS